MRLTALFWVACLVLVGASSPLSQTKPELTEIRPLGHEMLEVDHHRRWQLSTQPAGTHV